LDKLVVAEGIETQEQARFLNGLGCQIGQGYYFGKPMKGADIRDQFFPLTGKTVAQLAS
jgi:EAL domain-containing protein (putative c-di-GMP-specific phosphodiesterase class I)